MTTNQNIKLIVFSGPPCSGKSHLAEGLSEEMGATYLQMDKIRSILIPDSDQRKEHRQIAYRAMHFTANLLLRAGHNVILDATYIPFEHRREVEQIALAAPASLYLVECIVPSEIAVERFKSRDKTHPAVDLTASQVAELASTFPYSGNGLLLVTTTPAADCLASIEAYLSREQPVTPGEWSVSK